MDVCGGGSVLPRTRVRPAQRRRGFREHEVEDPVAVRMRQRTNVVLYETNAVPGVRHQTRKRSSGRHGSNFRGFVRKIGMEAPRLTREVQEHQNAHARADESRHRVYAILQSFSSWTSRQGFCRQHVSEERKRRDCRVPTQGTACARLLHE